MPNEVGFPEGLGAINYEYDYYAGSQVLIYFEDVLVDDCVRIAFQVQQSRTPVWGYATQYYNALGAGVIMVTGSFWVAFKEAAYIPVILKHITDRRTPDNGFWASPASRPASGTDFDSGLGRSAGLWQGRHGLIGEADAQRRHGGTGQVQRAEIERLLRAREQDPEDVNTNRELESLTLALGAANDRTFEDIAEVFEDALWYGGNGPGGGRQDAMSGNFAGGEMDEDQFLSIRRADQFPPFDILVTFGDINERNANHTLHRMVDVSITNTEFSGVEATGEPVVVRYDFMARNLM